MKNLIKRAGLSCALYIFGALLLFAPHSATIAKAQSLGNVEVRGNLQAFLLEEDQTLHLSVRTLAGIEILKLRRRAPFQPRYVLNGQNTTDPVAESQILLQGKRKRKNGKWSTLKGAGAHIRDGLLQVRFFGKRGRGYELSIPSDQALRESTR